MSEEWRPIPGYEGKYEVSNEGRVRSLDRIGHGTKPRRVKGRILSPGVSAKGYASVYLFNGGNDTGRSWQVHALVLTAFVSERPPGMWGLHNDGNPRNNRVGNLRWGTPSDNVQDSLRHGTQYQRNKTHCPRNHPYDEANTWISPAGYRACRTCNRDKLRRRRAAARGAA